MSIESATNMRMLEMNMTKNKAEISQDKGQSGWKKNSA